MKTSKGIKFTEMNDRKTMVAIRTHYNVNRYPKKYEATGKAHLTEPDQAFTLAEIIARSARGLQMHDEKVALYDAETSSDEDVVAGYIPSEMDYADMERIRNQQIALQQELRAKLARKEKAMQRKKQQDFAKKLNQEKPTQPEEIASKAAGAQQQRQAGAHEG